MFENVDDVRTRNDKFTRSKDQWDERGDEIESVMFIPTAGSERDHSDCGDGSVKGI